MKSQGLHLFHTSDTNWERWSILFRAIILLLLIIWITGFIYPIINTTYNPLMNFILKEFYSTVCHQDSSKCILVGADSMFVCARCAGIYLGGFIAGILSLFLINIKLNKNILFYFAIPMIVDVALTSFGVYPHSKTIAFSTGIMLGSTIYYFIINELEQFIFNGRLRGNEQ